MESSLVTIISNDDQEFQVTKEQCCRSSTLKNMMEMFEGNEKQDMPVPLKDISGDVLAKVVEWLKNHGKDAVWTKEEEKDYKVVDQYDRNFFANMDLALHFGIIKAANFLDIPRLMDNSCKLIAAMMAGQSVEDVREKFGIVNDYTPEEEEAIRRENAWLED